MLDHSGAVAGPGPVLTVMFDGCVNVDYIIAQHCCTQVDATHWP